MSNVERDPILPHRSLDSDVDDDALVPSITVAVVMLQGSVSGLDNNVKVEAETPLHQAAHVLDVMAERCRLVPAIHWSRRNDSVRPSGAGALATRRFDSSLTRNATSARIGEASIV